MVKKRLKTGGFDRFVSLFIAMDQTTKTRVKTELLVSYFDQADDEDKLWAVALLSGKRPKRTVTTTMLRKWAREWSQLPEWLFEESYHIVGDLAETIALLLPEAEKSSDRSLTDWIQWIRLQADKDEFQKRENIMSTWNELTYNERFIFNKILTGGFRVGVAKKTVIKALSIWSNKAENHLAHRLIGHWHPDQTTFKKLILEDHVFDDLSKPYPFLLAHTIESTIKESFKATSFQAEYKWDGIRGQLILREGNMFVWSRGEELITDRFPEFEEIEKYVKHDVVIDGEIMAFGPEGPLSFQSLQKRLGRKTVGKKLLAEAPIIFMAYDILELDRQDIRHLPLKDRRMQLVSLFQGVNVKSLLLSDVLECRSWEELSTKREESREIGAEGLMLKDLNSIYDVGRKKGLWWKWKVDPMTIDAVLLYAMRGHGRRSGLYSDLTFAVWDKDKLVPMAKAYSGLTDDELAEVTQFVNKNTIERFGPVRSVKPMLVFELAFDGIAESTRHKSGIALRFPRIKRWRHDKNVEEANTLVDLKRLLKES